MKVGFVGVGKWARQLADSFARCGADIVAHCRATGDRAEDFGQRLQLEEMCLSVDAIVAAAPPDPTAAAVRLASAFGVPVLATKPLFVEELIDVRATVFVDFWRLWSPCYRALKEIVTGHSVVEVEVTMCGEGPYRSFPGAFDYGPHAIAYLLDLVDEPLVVEGSTRLACGRGELFHVTGRAGDTRFELHMGNGAPRGQRKLNIASSDGRVYQLLEEPDSIVLLRERTTIMSTPKDRCLDPMVGNFLCRVATGRHDEWSLTMSSMANNMLHRIRRDQRPAT